MKQSILAALTAIVGGKIVDSEWVGQYAGSSVYDFSPSYGIKNDEEWGFVEKLTWCQYDDMMGIEIEVLNRCDRADIQTLKIGNSLASFGSSKSLRAPYCDVTELRFGDCIQKIAPVYDANNNIVDLEYHYADGDFNQMRGIMYSQLWLIEHLRQSRIDFGGGNCLVGISAAYSDQNIKGMRFHHTEGYKASECRDSAGGGVGNGGLVAFLLAFCCAGCVCMVFATYCCGMELPPCIVESCWYKNGFFFCCDWGQNHTKEDRSKRYEEPPQQQMATTTTTVFQPPVMVQQPPVLVQQAPQMMPVDLTGNGLVDGYAVQQRPPVMVQQAPIMMQQQPQVYVQQNIVQQ